MRITGPDIESAVSLNLPTGHVIIRTKTALTKHLGRHLNKHVLNSLWNTPNPYPLFQSHKFEY